MYIDIKKLKLYFCTETIKAIYYHYKVHETVTIANDKIHGNKKALKTFARLLLDTDMSTHIELGFKELTPEQKKSKEYLESFL